MAKNRICELRKAAGMSQKELGAKLGVAQTTVSAWEVGRNEPDTDSFKRMAEIFEASMEYVMGYGTRSVTHGLTGREYEKRIKKIRQEDFERQADSNEEVFTEKEIEELEENSLLSEWQEKNPDIFFETFVIEQIFENLTKEQRKHGRELIEVYSAGIRCSNK